MATQTAKMTGLSVRRTNDIFQRIRVRLAIECEKVSPFEGELEADESYFGARRVRGQRGRGAGMKTLVFGLLKRDDRVYTEIAPNVTKATLRAVIRGHADRQSVIHPDGWSGHDGRVDLGYERHHRVNHRSNQFALGPNHIHGIKSFWGFAKHRLTRFRGINRKTVPFHGKEAEFRFNHRAKDLYKVLKITLQKGATVGSFAS